MVATPSPPMPRASTTQAAIAPRRVRGGGTVRRARVRTGRRASSRLIEGPSQVGLAQELARAQLLGRTGEEGLAEVEHVDPRADPQHHLDVVLDEQDAEPVVGD